MTVLVKTILMMLVVAWSLKGWACNDVETLMN